MHSTLFNDSELKDIENAVEHLESKFAIELVPAFASESDDYPIARFRAVMIGLISGFLVLAALNYWVLFALLPFVIQGLILIIWVLFVLAMVEYIPPIQRKIIGDIILDQKSFDLAKNQFIDYEVYSNPQRVGILLFVSFFEHKFHIISDRRASEFISTEDWEEISKQLSSDFKKTSASNAIVLCIENIENLLKKRNFTSENLGPSILPNHLNVSE